MIIDLKLDTEKIEIGANINNNWHSGPCFSLLNPEKHN